MEIQNLNFNFVEQTRHKKYTWLYAWYTVSKSRGIGNILFKTFKLQFFPRVVSKDYYLITAVLEKKIV